jgi:hypothetical protein
MPEQAELALSIAATFSSRSGEPWLIDNSFGLFKLLISFFQRFRE